METSMTETLSAPRTLFFLWLLSLLLPGLAHAAAARPIVSVSSPGAGSSYAMPFRIAEEQSFYLDEGLDVRIMSGVRTATSVQMLVGGTVDATQTVGPTTLAAILRGVPLKIVMVFNDKPSYWLYSKKNIRSFAELKGRRISSSTPGSTNDRLLKLVLERNGIDWKNDLQIVYIGTSDVVIRALLAESIDAAVLSHPGNLIAKDAGYHQLASFENEVGALTGGVAVHGLTFQRASSPRALPDIQHVASLLCGVESAGAADSCDQSTMASRAILTVSVTISDWNGDGVVDQASGYIATYDNQDN
jgi:NitT/TauT family transport system substrate-binding protein